MPDQKTDDRTLAEREDDASDAFNDLRADALDMKDRLDDLGSDVSGLETRVGAMDEQMFDITVQQSGAMDLMGSPLVDDTDATLGIAEIVVARIDDLRGDLVEAHDDLTGVRHDLADLEGDLVTGLERADALTVEVEAIRADGGDIHPDHVAPLEHDDMDDWMDAQLHDTAPTGETHAE